MIQSLQTRLFVDLQGYLQIKLPQELAGVEVNLVVVYQTIAKEKINKPSQWLNLYGCCSDNPIKINNQGILDEMDNDLE